MRPSAFVLAAPAATFLFACAAPLTGTESVGGSPAQLLAAPASSTTPLLFASELTCGDQLIEVGILDDASVLRANGRDYALSPVATASGEKYAWPGTPETSLWSKGDVGQLVLEGETFPECVRTGGYADQTVQDAPASGP